MRLAMKVGSKARAADKRLMACAGRFYHRELATLTNEEVQEVINLVKPEYEKGGGYKSEIKKVLRAAQSELTNRKKGAKR